MTMDFNFSCKMDSRGLRMGKKVFTIGVFFLGLALTVLNAQTWSHLRRLTWNSGYSMDVNIAIIWGDNLHLVWQDSTTTYCIYEIFYKSSLDGGVNWSGTKRLTWTNSQSFNPAIAVDSTNNIYVVWEQYDSGSSEIYYKKSTNGGTTWTTKRLTWNTEDSSSPTIAVDSSDNIHLVWHDYTPGSSDIYYKKSTDGGATWATKRLTWSAGHSYIPTIAIDSADNIHVVWYDYASSNYEIFYKKSTDGGTTWITKRLTWNPGNSYYPAIAIDSTDNIHVAWFDSTPPGNYEIYYTGSTNGGATWKAKRLTWNTAYSSGTAIATNSNDNIFVVWSDETPGNFEIYCKKGIQ
jgi:phage terminase large subunit-like protein